MSRSRTTYQGGGLWATSHLRTESGQFIVYGPGPVIGETPKVPLQLENS